MPTAKVTHTKDGKVELWIPSRDAEKISSDKLGAGARLPGEGENIVRKVKETPAEKKG